MEITDSRRRRAIVNTDAKNEADDQFAIVHALLSPSLDIRGIIPAHFGTRRGDNSMLESREEVDKLLGMLGMPGAVRVENGAPHALPDEHRPVDSPGARLIIEEAHRTDAGPLFVSFLGPITDLASALLLDPSIAATDTTVIWIGGPPYGDLISVGSSPEFNLSNDIAAANVVLASGIRLWQVPSNIYRLVSVSYAELRQKVEPHGELGRYLAQQVVDFNTEHHKVPIESRSLGDSPAIGLMLEPWSGVFREQSPVRFDAHGQYEPSSAGAPFWVCEQVDTRFLLEDMFAKLAEFATSR